MTTSSVPDARGGGFVPVVHGATRDRPDEADTIDAAEAIASSLGRLGYATEILAVDLDLSPLERLAQRRPTAVFNLVEALRGDGRLATVPIAVMEHLGLRLTGAGVAAYAASTSKLLTKDRLAAEGIPAPALWRADAGGSNPARVIVKSVDEHASIGIDAGSVVDAAEAAAEIARREARFGGRFFAEAYIPGREFNASVIEMDGTPQVLAIPEIDFSTLPDGRLAIVDYGAKWDPSDPAYHATQRFFGLERTEPALARELAALALRAWRAFGLSGYARVDFRVASDGTPYVLEVNANPCLAPDAGFIATATQAGLTFDGVIAAVVTAALQRPSAGVS